MESSHRNIVGVFLAFFSSAVFAQTTLQAAPIGAKLRDVGHPLIINGQEANAAEYPAVFLSGVNPLHMCTWFLVSARTLIGAAHCLHGASGDEAIRRISITAEGKTYSGDCEIADRYPTDPSSDWAACFITPPYQMPQAVDTPVSGFEVLNTASDRLQPAQKIEISGFGCTVDGGSVVNGYQIGQARIVQLPPSAHIAGAIVQTPNAISIRQAPAIICQGDSGGPAFLYQKSGRVFRVVVGVNSSTVIAAGTGYLASTSTSAAKAFFSTWADRVGDRLCGLHADAVGCRPFLK